MALSREARLVSVITVLTVVTIVYNGVPPLPNGKPTSGA